MKKFSKMVILTRLDNRDNDFLVLDGCKRCHHSRMARQELLLPDLDHLLSDCGKCLFEFKVYFNSFPAFRALESVAILGLRKTKGMAPTK